MSTPRKIQPDPIEGHVNLSDIWRRYGSVQKNRPSAWLSMLDAGLMIDGMAHLYFPDTDLKDRHRSWGELVYKGRPFTDWNSRFRVDTFAHHDIASAYESWLSSKGDPIEEPAGPLFARDHNGTPIVPGDTLKLTIGDSEITGTFTGAYETFEEAEAAADNFTRPTEGTPVADILELARESRKHSVPFDIDLRGESALKDFFAPYFNERGDSGRQAISFLKGIVALMENAATVPMDRAARHQLQDRVSKLEKLCVDHLGEIEVLRKVVKDLADSGTINVRLNALEKRPDPVGAKIVERVDEAMARWTAERVREWAYVQTLVPWAMGQGINLTVQEATREGKILANHCRESNLPVAEYLDPRGFNVKTYPEAALRWWLTDYRTRHANTDPSTNERSPRLGFRCAETNAKFVPLEWFYQTDEGDYFPRGKYAPEFLGMGVSWGKCRIPSYIKPVPENTFQEPVQDSKEMKKPGPLGFRINIPSPEHGDLHNRIRVVKFVPTDWMMRSSLTNQWIPKMDFMVEITNLGIPPEKLRIPSDCHPSPNDQNTPPVLTINPPTSG